MAKSIAFVETWTNPIYVRFANEFTRQNPDIKVYFITDADAPAADFEKRITVVRLKNRKLVRRLVYFPLWLASSVSASAAQRYADTLYLHTYKGLTRTLDRIKPDVIQANVLLMPYAMQAGCYSRKHNIPFIIRTEEQEPRTFLQRIMLNTVLGMNMKILNYASLIVPWTVQGERFAKKRLDARKVVLIPAGVDDKTFKPKTSYSKKLPIKLLAVQRFVPYKDYPTLLKSLKQALDAGADLKLSILGVGPLEQDTKRLVTELGLSSHVTFLKQVPYSAMPSLLRSHDALVLTSHYEAIGMVVPEAMACGTPTIVSDSAGALTYLTKDCGIVFKTGDVNSLARALESLTLQKIEKTGKKARQHIQRYTIHEAVKQYTQIIKSRGILKHA